MPQRSPRRSLDEWQSLVDQQHASGLTARAFCSCQDIGYISFLQWRKRLSDDGALPTFVEVTPQTLLAPQSVVDRSPVQIDLDLGDGMTLRISRQGRYHGVFAPSSRLRGQITPARRGKGGRPGIEPTEDHEHEPARPRRSMTWAQRLRRVFNIDIETCEACGGPPVCQPDSGHLV